MFSGGGCLVRDDLAPLAAFERWPQKATQISLKIIEKRFVGRIEIEVIAVCVVSNPVRHVRFRKLCQPKVRP